MLNASDLSELYVFQECALNGSKKELLGKLLFEYIQYTQCGTIEECQRRKEWMDYSLNDIMANFNAMVKGLREEVDNIKKRSGIE